MKGFLVSKGKYFKSIFFPGSKFCTATFNPLPAMAELVLKVIFCEQALPPLDESF